MISILYTILAFIAIFIQSVVGQSSSAAGNPPACLLQAVNSFASPSNVKSICSQSSSVNDLLNSGCGVNVATAMVLFNSICGDAGVSVTLTASSSATGSSSGSSGGSASTTATNTGGAKASSTTTTTATSKTGAANAMNTGLSIYGFSGAGLAIAGLAVML